MRNTFGNVLTVTLFGESHGPVIGAVLDGLPAGLPVDGAFIRADLARRAPADSTATARHEKDEIQLAGGVFNDRTTGAPVCIVLANEDVHSGGYSAAQARPGHADYTAFCKYGGFADYRGGGHLSGRLTAALVAAGALVKAVLLKKGIRFQARVTELGGSARAEEFTELLQSAKSRGDSLGGVVSLEITGVPAGVGEPWFDSVESMLSHAFFAIPAVKGVEFGTGFELAALSGSEANDALYVENGSVLTRTNHNGGINGGITNGMPVTARIAFKPTPSIAKVQESVDLLRQENVSLQIRGRHDTAVAVRAPVIVEDLAALVLADLLLQNFGPEWFR